MFANFKKTAIGGFFCFVSADGCNKNQLLFDKTLLKYACNDYGIYIFGTSFSSRGARRVFLAIYYFL